MQSIGERQELRRLFFWRRQVRGRCGCRTAATGSAHGTVRFDVQEGSVRGRWRGGDFRLRGTRTPPLAAVGRRGSRQRLQRYPVDPYRLPVALTVCGRKISRDLRRVGLNTFAKRPEIAIGSIGIFGTGGGRIKDHVLETLDREEDEVCAVGGGLQGISSLSRGFESNRIRSHLPGRNSGAVVAKKMSRFEVIKLRLGMAIV